MLVNEHLRWRRRAARQILRADVYPDRSEPDLAERSGNHHQVVALLASLPPRQRTAMVLRYFSGLSDLEIADAMACSPGTVRSHLSRALATMRIDLSREAIQTQEDRS